MKHKKKTLVATALSLLADVAVKWLIQTRFTKTLEFGNLLHIKKTYNTGMALGLFANSGMIRLVLPPLVILIGWLVLRGYELNAAGQIGEGMLLGGFLGNYVERALSGHVTDMLYFPWLPWFVCNVADLCICTGAVLTFLSLLCHPKEEDHAGF